MKLNLGCGHNKLEGFVNVDAAAACAPDQVVDLEAFPWPWPDSSVEAVVFNHSLEHMGRDPKVFIRLMQELYRVCAPGAEIFIVVPHPRHDHFLGDPTHVRPITTDVLMLFDRQLNDEWKASGQASTPLAHYTGVDFKVTRTQVVLDEPWASQSDRGELDREALIEAMRRYNNVVRELRISVVARK